MLELFAEEDCGTVFSFHSLTVKLREKNFVFKTFLC